MANQVKATTTKVDTFSTQLEKLYADLKTKIAQVDTDLIQMLKDSVYGPKFNQ